MRTLRVKVAADYLFTLWFFFVLLLLISCFALCFNAYWTALFFLISANLCLVPLLRVGPLEMNEEYIRIRLAVGCFEIAWDEIEWIEINDFETFMVLHGENKKLLIYARSLWRGREKDDVYRLFRHQIEDRELKVVESEKVQWQLSKGTRVKEF